MANRATLTTLPDALLRSLLHHLDLQTLLSLSETCRQLHAAVNDDAFWQQLVQRRYHVTRRQLRRPQTAMETSSKALYAAWHQQRRMPSTFQSGPSYAAFARGEICRRDAIFVAWGTVLSTDDCRLVGDALRVRFVLQNCSARRVHIAPADFVTTLTDGLAVPVVHHARARVDRAYGCAVSEVRVECGARETDVLRAFQLGVDQIAFVVLDIYMKGVLFELDALERLDCVTIPLRFQDGESERIVARFRDVVIWGNYERLPGGWWVRNATSASRR